MKLLDKTSWLAFATSTLLLSHNAGAYVAANTYRLGGSVSGLVAGGTLVINNGTTTLSIASSGTFSFPLTVSSGTNYAITVAAQPAGQLCSVINGSGTVVQSSITNIQINCTNASLSFVAPNPSIVLGAPTATTVAMNFFSADKSGTLSVSYGTKPGIYNKTSATLSLSAGAPAILKLTGLTTNTQYYYRVNFTPSLGTSLKFGEYLFHTARPQNSTFTFVVQADSHLDENTDPTLYKQTLANMLLDSPDFMIDLGDTFMTEKHVTPLDVTATSPPASAEWQVIDRYQYELPYFARVTHSLPLFLVNGNHDAELGWVKNGQSNRTLNPLLATWATKARLNYFANPIPDTFYSGDTTTDLTVGTQRAAWYSWQWGDALFVALDPYWNSSNVASTAGGGWYQSLGKAQYDWLSSVLAQATAQGVKYKFIFIHNLVGGLPLVDPLTGLPIPNATNTGDDMRGGTEAAKYFEWGGLNADGITNGFYTNNLNNHIGWPKSIHQLLVDNKVTAVFHGHDHVYVKQDLDGIIYQAVPQPSAKGTSNGLTLAKIHGYLSGTIISSSGHIRVTVSPSGVKSEYVRAWLPTCTSPSFPVSCETATNKNRDIAHAWTVQ